MTDVSVEKKALVVGAILNITMAFSGWFAYYSSNSQSILLDGNYSFISFFVILIAIRISIIKAQPTEMFPFGQYVYEALYSFAKGIMIVSILLVAVIMSITRISRYLNGSPVDALDTSVVLIYTIAMVLSCVILGVYCRHQNKKINNSSSILRAEYIGAKLDGIISLATGLALIGIGYVNIEGNFAFVHYIGDAILVFILALLLIKEPFELIRDSFVELAGGTLQNKEEKEKIEKILTEHLTIDLLKKSYISKTGSSYFIVAYINGQGIDKIGFEKLEQIKAETLSELKKIHQYVMFEIAID
jgi:cation diffusion facilitator family transporter